MLVPQKSLAFFSASYQSAAVMQSHRCTKSKFLNASLNRQSVKAHANSKLLSAIPRLLAVSIRTSGEGKMALKH